MPEKKEIINVEEWILDYSEMYILYHRLRAYYANSKEYKEVEAYLGEMVKHNKSFLESLLPRYKEGIILETIDGYNRIKKEFLVNYNKFMIRFKVYQYNIEKTRDEISEKIEKISFDYPGRLLNSMMGNREIIEAFYSKIGKKSKVQGKIDKLVRENKRIYLESLIKTTRMNQKNIYIEYKKYLGGYEKFTDNYIEFMEIMEDENKKTEKKYVGGIANIMMYAKDSNPERIKRRGFWKSLFGIH